jgi:GNAT superfamily N-acetyltransferase
LLWDFNTEFGTPTPPVEVLVERLAELVGRDDVLVVLGSPDEGGYGTGNCSRTDCAVAFLTLRPSVWFEGPVAQLEELYVQPELRGQGMGSSVLTFAVEAVLARGAQEIHINVDEVDHATRRFYERHGFVNIEPGADYRMLCYLRELPPGPSGRGRS